MIKSACRIVISIIGTALCISFGVVAFKQVNQHLHSGTTPVCVASLNPYAYRLTDAVITVKTPHQISWRTIMYDDRANFDQRSAPFWDRLHIDPKPRIQKLEERARESNLIFRKDIQILLKLAYSAREPAILESAIRRLEVALDAYDIGRQIREPDFFKPYGPEYLLSRGNVHLMTQMDGVRWLIPVDTMLTGAILVGPQQSGKSRCLINLCLEIRRIDPSIIITIVDPKDGFRDYAPLLSARRIDLSRASFSLKSPDNVDERDFVLEFAPLLCDTAGLIYGVEVTTESALIALQQLQRWRQATNRDSELSLKDIYIALSLVDDASSGRRLGYREAAQTALRRIIGEKGLLACRKGISMNRLFGQNTIINARGLMDPMQCRAFALFLVYWKYQQHRYTPESNRLTHLICFDDATMWFGTPGEQFGAASRTSPLGHILAMLRATGTGIVVSTQLPSFLDPSVIALSRTMVAIGPTSGSQQLKVISDFMSLNKEQAAAMTKLSIREAVGFSPGTTVKSCVHGWIPTVETPPILACDQYETDIEDSVIEPWQNLAEIPAPVINLTGGETISATSAEATATAPVPIHPVLTSLPANVQRILWDCACYPFASVSARVRRLNMSGRAFNDAKEFACQQGYLIQSSAGRTLYLIPAEMTFVAFNIQNPYKRATSVEHAFYVQLACFLLEKDSRYKSVRAEQPIGDSGSTSDAVTITHDGHMEAWEVCLGTSHLLENAAKYGAMAYAKVTFLARTYELSLTIKSFFKVSNLEPALLAKLDFMHFSQLLQQQRRLSLY